MILSQLPAALSCVPPVVTEVAIGANSRPAWTHWMSVALKELLTGVVGAECWGLVQQKTAIGHSIMHVDLHGQGRNQSLVCSAVGSMDLNL